MLKEIKEYARTSWVPVILDDSLEYVKMLFHDKKFERILEIGTAIGYSSINFCEFLTKTGKIDTIENDPQRLMIAKANIDMLGLNEKINIIEGDASKELLKLKGKYDFIFMDGPKSHYKDHLAICLSLLNDNGTIIADNVEYKGMVPGPEFIKHKQRTIVVNLREFISEVENNEMLSSELVVVGDGLLVIKKKEN